MRSLNKSEMMAVSGAGTTATTTACADKAAKKAAFIAAIKAKFAAKKSKHSCNPQPECPTTPPTPTEEEVVD